MKKLIDTQKTNRQIEKKNYNLQIFKKYLNTTLYALQKYSLEWKLLEDYTVSL